MGHLYTSLLPQTPLPPANTAPSHLIEQVDALEHVVVRVPVALQARLDLLEVLQLTCQSRRLAVHAVIETVCSVDQGQTTGGNLTAGGKL